MAHAELLRDGVSVRVFDAAELKKTTAILPAGGETVYVTGRADRAYPAHPAADESEGPYAGLLLDIRVIKDAANQHLSDLMASPSASAAVDDDDEDEAEDEDEEEDDAGTARSKAPQVRSATNNDDAGQKKPRTC